MYNFFPFIVKEDYSLLGSPNVTHGYSNHGLHVNCLIVQHTSTLIKTYPTFAENT